MLSFTSMLPVLTSRFTSTSAFTSPPTASLPLVIVAFTLLPALMLSFTLISPVPMVMFTSLPAITSSFTVTAPLSTFMFTSLSAFTLAPTVMAPDLTSIFTSCLAVTFAPTVILPSTVVSMSTFLPAVISLPTLILPVPVVRETVPLLAVMILPTSMLPFLVFMVMSCFTMTSVSMPILPSPRVSTFRLRPAVTSSVTTRSPLVMIRFASRPAAICPFWAKIMFWPFAPFTYSSLAACTVISPVSVLVLPKIVILPLSVSSFTFSLAHTVSASLLSPIVISPSFTCTFTLPIWAFTVLSTETLPLAVTFSATLSPATTLPLPLLPT